MRHASNDNSTNKGRQGNFGVNQELNITTPPDSRASGPTIHLSRANDEARDFGHFLLIQARQQAREDLAYLGHNETQRYFSTVLTRCVFRKLYLTAVLSSRSDLAWSKLFRLPVPAPPLLLLEKSGQVDTKPLGSPRLACLFFLCSPEGDVPRMLPRLMVLYGSRGRGSRTGG